MENLEKEHFGLVQDLFKIENPNLFLDQESPSKNAAEKWTKFKAENTIQNGNFINLVESIEKPLLLNQDNEQTPKKVAKSDHDKKMDGSASKPPLNSFPIRSPLKPDEMPDATLEPIVIDLVDKGTDSHEMQNKQTNTEIDLNAGINMQLTASVVPVTFKRTDLEMVPNSIENDSFFADADHSVLDATFDLDSEKSPRKPTMPSLEHHSVKKALKKPHHLKTPYHYYASPLREASFSPLKRRKLFSLGGAPEYQPAFIHVSPPPPSVSKPVVPHQDKIPTTGNNADPFKIPLNPAGTTLAPPPSVPPPQPAALATEPTIDNAQPALVSSSVPATAAIDNLPSETIVGGDLQPVDNLGFNLLATKLKIAAKGLCSVLPTASKVVLTKDWNVAQEEVRLTNLISHLDRLKEHNMLSFKQLKPQTHPPRPKAHWHYLLEEMAWMSEDFRQERRWKIAAAYNMAQWVMSWHNATDKSLVCVYIPPKQAPSEPSSVRPGKHPLSTVLEPTDENDAASSLKQAWRPGSGGHVPDIDHDMRTVDPVDLVLPVAQQQDSSFPVTLNLVCNTYSISQLAPPQSGLSHLDTYSCPVAAEGDVYKEPEDAIFSVSKFMLNQYVAIDGSKWDSWGSRKQIDLDGEYRSTVTSIRPHYFSSKSIPRYETPALFSFSQSATTSIDRLDILPTADPEKVAGVNGEMFPGPAGSRPDPPTASTSWTSDEEEALWQFIHIYSGNWALVSDSLNGVRVGNSGKRSIWCCYEKYTEMANAMYSPQCSVDYLYASTQSNKKDKKVKALGLLSTFNFITGLAKRRDTTKPLLLKPNKQVNLNAHHTHRDAKVEKGIDLNAPPLRPVELSKLKDQRDQQLEQTRATLAFNARPIAPQIRPPVMNANIRPVIRPNMAINTQQRPPAQQQQAKQMPPGFRPSFQGSPQPAGSPSSAGTAMRGYTPEQMQQLMSMNRGIIRPGQPVDMNNAAVLGMSNMIATGMSAQNIQQMQNMRAAQMAHMAQLQGQAMRPPGMPAGGMHLAQHASTAAAYAALQNVQNAVKQNFRAPGTIGMVQARPMNPTTAIPASSPLASSAGSAGAFNPNESPLAKEITESPQSSSLLQPPPVDQERPVPDVQKTKSGASRTASPSNAKTISANLTEGPRRTSRHSNPSAVPSASVVVAAPPLPVAAPSGGGDQGSRQSRQSRSRRKQVAVSEDEDELEEEEEDELEETEASSISTSIEESPPRKKGKGRPKRSEPETGSSTTTKRKR